MLLPDNIHPKSCIYYTGALVLGEFQENTDFDIVELFNTVKNKYKIQFDTYILTLDWLYLIEAIVVDEYGRVNKCI